MTTATDYVISHHWDADSTCPECERQGVVYGRTYYVGRQSKADGAQLCDSCAEAAPFGMADILAAVSDLDGAIWCLKGAEKMTAITHTLNLFQEVSSGWVDDTVQALGLTPVEHAASRAVQG